MKPTSGQFARRAMFAGHVASWFKPVQVCSQTLSGWLPLRASRRRPSALPPRTQGEDTALGPPTSAAPRPPGPASDAGRFSQDGAVAPAGSAASTGTNHRNDGVYSTASVATIFLSTAHMAQLALRGQLQPMPSRMEHQVAAVDPSVLPTALPIREDNASFDVLQPEVDAARCPAGNFIELPQNARAAGVCLAARPM